MRIHRCPRCRAEDITTDAHPARLLDNGVARPFFVCRNCYRAAELEFRIACETADVAYVPLAIREGLALLRDFYRARIAERLADTDAEDAPEIALAVAPIRAVLNDVERRLAIAPVDAS